MQYKDINIFLELVRTRNITKAAEHLFLSQSTISSRLKSLEEELGCQLVIRSKGQRVIQLTRAGQDFIFVAERWLHLFEETEALCHTALKTLRIASNESTYHGYVIPFLNKFFKKYPQYNLSVQINDSGVIYDLVEKNLVDIGLVSYESYRPGLVCRKIRQLPLCVVMYDTCPQEAVTIHPLELKPEKEIRFSGGQFGSMKRWREKWFGANAPHFFEINSGVGTYYFLENTDHWMMLPLKIARIMAQKMPLQIYRLTDEPDPWEIFMIKQGKKGPNIEVCRIFEAGLLSYIDSEK